MSASSMKTFASTVIAVLAVVGFGNVMMDGVHEAMKEPNSPQFRPLHLPAAAAPAPAQQVVESASPKDPAKLSAAAIAVPTAGRTGVVKAERSAAAPGASKAATPKTAVRTGGSEDAAAPSGKDGADSKRRSASAAQDQDKGKPAGKGGAAAKEAVAAAGAASPSSAREIQVAQLLNEQATPAKAVREPAVGAKSAIPAAVLVFTEMKYADHGDTGEVQMNGRAEPGAHLRFTMDGERIGKATADKDGVWKLKAEKVLVVGPHWISAEQLDSNGEVIARAESPYDREEAAKPSAEPAPNPTVTASSEAKPAETRTAAAQSPEIKTPEAKSAETRPTEAKKPEIKPAPAAAPAVEQPAVAKPAAPSVEDGGLKQTAEKIWDKFTGIFKVDPAGDGKTVEAGKDAPAHATAKADNPAGAPAQDNKPAVAGDGTSGTTAQPASTSASLAFIGVSHETGNEGVSLQLSGHADAGSHVRLYDGANLIGDVMADRKGRWTFSKRGDVKPGLHLFRAAHVLDSGRIDAEVRMQYDHVVKAKVAVANNRDVAAAVKTVDAAKDGKASTAKKVAASTPAAASAKKSLKRTAGRGERASKKVASAVKTGGPRHAHKKKRPQAFALGKYTRRYYMASKDKSRYFRNRRTMREMRRSGGQRAILVRIEEGETLSGYARRYCGEGHAFEAIDASNRRQVANPDLIFPGQYLVIACL